LIDGAVSRTWENSRPVAFPPVADEMELAGWTFAPYLLADVRRSHSIDNCDAPVLENIFLVSGSRVTL
jgi:hypothetical protein